MELLRTQAGEEALEAAALLLDGDRLSAASTLRAHFGPELAAAALTQAELRRKAVSKFGPAASEMFFTRAGLEQATRGVVAARRAARLSSAGASRVADLGCGIGADLRALSIMIAYGVEVDPVTASCAAHNAPDATVICGDVRDFDLSSVDAVFCDPARRSGSRRIFRPADYSPPWEWVSSLPERVPMTVLKLAPGIDQSLLPRGCELELVSVGGEVVEAAAWCGPLAQVPRRATVMPHSPAPVPHASAHSPAAVPHASAHELVGTGLEQAPVAGPRRYLYDPDGAVVRAHLVAEFAETVEGTLADATIAYVWADRPTPTPFGRCFEVDEVLPFSLKRLRAALRQREVGRLEILKRGSALDVEALRKDLRLSGAASASLLLTRVAGAPVAVIASPCG